MKMLQLLAVVAFGALMIAAPGLAQEKKSGEGKAEEVKTAPAQKFPPPTTPIFSGAGLGAGLGMALTIIGAAYGMGKIGSSALESMARQPEVAARVQTAMIIIAAMLEGATLASVILCYLLGSAATF